MIHTLRSSLPPTFHITGGELCPQLGPLLAHRGGCFAYAQLHVHDLYEVLELRIQRNTKLARDHRGVLASPPPLSSHLQAHSGGVRGPM
ncbi:hypothetical protein BDM02DRAFT_1973871 [Thelephora ganbajun]|uniref:Uncharacterized protein n=1 Tax=Thelephora ganbajun TaxID=370292 RepID=A0ACB6YZG3_THEGA|nr:hypothetical protein BDM02DRAFT_1973871 [Thelephora ganbajun]